MSNTNNSADKVGRNKVVNKIKGAKESKFREKLQLIDEILTQRGDDSLSFGIVEEIKAYIFGKSNQIARFIA